ncbi:hypothetical protein UWK_01031 [Desulfocapsa sulfexigens DSM 10523]|uniref:Uncharacterized protein n=1 Tax=Desulfocapsa sulfexigens (strain DSM 10523 / SB164P1) TaxID=1167006 RepID=M1P295_DESSD|nr:hypothetical protein UWK_01031 [Desulfocapsa sulfexigens DSM 10523]
MLKIIDIAFSAIKLHREFRIYARFYSVVEKLHLLLTPRAAPDSLPCAFWSTHLKNHYPTLNFLLTNDATTLTGYPSL